MYDLISRQSAIKAICEDGTWLESQGCTEITMAERKQRDADILGEFPSAQTEPFTDEEQRIFLSAMGREEHVCKHVDAVYGDSYEDGLLRICHNITRKVKGALWT